MTEDKDNKDKEALRKKRRADKLLDHALAMGNVEAQDAGKMAFSARAVVLASLPYRDPGDVPIFGRGNGKYSLAIEPGGYFKGGRKVTFGYPFGNIPRLLLAWMTTEVVRKKSRELVFGDSLRDFMSQLGLQSTGGQEGSIRRLRMQMTRLFAARISCTFQNEEKFSFRNVTVASNADFWWDPLHPNDSTRWEPCGVTLGEEFYQEIVDRPVPLDLRVLQAIKQSPLALDIYAWLTYRMSYLKRKTTIPWPSLRVQFGSDYARLRDFKKSFLEQLRAVKMLYSHARFSTESDYGLTIYPSRPQVLKKDHPKI
jgi:hypothetical protein